MSDSTALLIETKEQARDALARFASSDRTLAFDTETSGLQVRSVYGDKGRTIQFAFRPWHEAVVFEMNDHWLPDIREFFGMAETLVAHNLKFDAHVVHTYLGESLFDAFHDDAFHDTGWLARLHDERDGGKLKSLSSKYLSDDAADEQTALKRLMSKNGWTWGTVPVEHLVAYGGLDAVLTGQLFDYFMPRIGYAKDAYRREQRLARVLYAMERAGVLVDRGMLETARDAEQGAADTAAAAIQTLAPGINTNSTPQLLAALQDRGLDIENTQAATLKRTYIETGDALIESLLVYRKHAKTLGTYLTPWLDLITPEDRLHPSFNSLGAKTGRMSSDNPNFQNITRGHLLRDAFVAAPGHRMIVADWNQMELRLYAHFAQDAMMRSAFLAGQDIYQQAADLLGVGRPTGKMIMLAAIYGAGAKTMRLQAVNMAYRLGYEDLVPTLLAYDWEDLHHRFHQAYAIRNLARLTELQARRRGMVGEAYITTLGGRRQRPKTILLPAVNGYRQRVPLYKDLANALVQGSSADMMKDALISVYEQGGADYLRLTVHDEMVLEVPESEVEDISKVIEGAMTHYEFTPPLTIGIGTGTSYGEAK